MTDYIKPPDAELRKRLTRRSMRSPNGKALSRPSTMPIGITRKEECYVDVVSIRRPVIPARGQI